MLFEVLKFDVLVNGPLVAKKYPRLHKYRP